MNTPVQALAWQIWGRNRLGLWAMLGVLMLAGLVVRLIPEEMRSGDAVKYVVLGSVLVFCYPISIFTYSNIGPGRVQPSLRFPRPMFHLPVPTWMLVAVPMVAGMVFCALLWAVMEALVIRPFGVELPFTLPALGLAAALGFFQALAWSPFGASLVRASVATVLGTGAVQLALWACLGAEVPVERPWLLLCGFIGLSYAGALFGVSRERRGGSSGGPGMALRAREWASGVLPRWVGRFASARQAQVWFDLRTRGLVFVLLGGTFALLPLVDSMFLRFRGESGSLILFGFGTLTPLWSAALLGPYFAKPSLWGRTYALPGFTAVRPLTTGELYLATVRAALWSVLALWVLIAVVTAVRLVVAGTPEGLDTGWAMALERHGAFGVWLRVAALAAALVVLTLGSLVGGLTVGLAGRTWVVTASDVLQVLSRGHHPLERTSDPGQARGPARSATGRARPDRGARAGQDPVGGIGVQHVPAQGLDGSSHGRRPRSGLAVRRSAARHPGSRVRAAGTVPCRARALRWCGPAAAPGAAGAGSRGAGLEPTSLERHLNGADERAPRGEIVTSTRNEVDPARDAQVGIRRARYSLPCVPGASRKPIGTGPLVLMIQPIMAPVHRRYPPTIRLQRWPGPACARPLRPDLARDHHSTTTAATPQPHALST